MNSIPVLGIEEIAFEVQDIEQSVAFYRDIVGLELLSRGPQQVWFRVGAQKLALFTRDRVGSGQHFAFRIPADMAEQVRNAIVSAGFPEETMEQDDGLSVYVRDPDGNKIELYGGREGLTKRGSQPLAVAMRTFNFMKKFREFALLAPTDGGL